MKLSQNIQIAAGAVAGVLFGLLLHWLGPVHPLYSPLLFVFGLAAGIFMGLLKMILIPLVFTSITVGIANLRAHAQMGKVWKYTLGYFIATTALAVFSGLVAVNLFHPGRGLDIAMLTHASHFKAQSLTMGEFVRGFVQGLFANPLAAMADGNVLPTIVFAIFLGVALIVAGERAGTILNFFNQFFDLIMLMVGWIMKILPIGLMALLAKLVASQDIALFKVLGEFMLLVIGMTLFHGFVTLPLVLWGMSGMHPKRFFKGMGDALVTAFSTSSSSATLPVTMRCVKDHLKADQDVAGFVLPLGATVNMDGTALYEAIAAIFVANLTGAHLSFIQQLIVFLTAIIAAIGAPGIPSAGMVTMMMVLKSVGLPIEAIAILLPIDRILDATRTMINVEGDAVGTCVVDRLLRPGTGHPR